MFNLDRTRIHELAGNDTVYSRGRSLHESKQVVRFHWAENGLLLEADIRDHQIEHVHIRLAPDGLPATRSCTCRESDGTGLCRHQVTLLLEARERQRAKDAYSSHTGGSLPDGPLRLRTLLIIPPNPSMPAAIELEIGVSDLRPVLDIATFLHAWRNGDPARMAPTPHMANGAIAVNGSLAANGSSEANGYDLPIPAERARLPISSQLLADWLAELSETFHPQKPRTIFSDLRSLRIPSTALAVFLPLASATGTAYWTDATRRQTLPLVYVEANLPPLSFHLDGQLHLHMVSAEPLVFLDEALTAFRTGNRFFVPSHERLNALFPVMDAMHKARRSVLTFSILEATRFVIEQLPGMAGIVPVTLAPEATLLASPAPLQSRVFLELSGRSITARIRFCYGNWETDPLHLSGLGVLSPLRDMLSENGILKRFRLAGFMPVENRLALHGDEAQYEFLRNVLPQLRLETELEEGESFSRQMRIHPAPITFTLSPGKSSGWLKGIFHLHEVSEEILLPKAELPLLLTSLKNGSHFYRSQAGRFFSLDEEGLPLLTAILDDPSVRAMPSAPLDPGKADNTMTMTDCLMFDIPAYRLPPLAGLGRQASDQRQASLQRDAAIRTQDTFHAEDPFRTEDTFRNDSALQPANGFNRFQLEGDLRTLTEQMANPDMTPSNPPVLPASLDMMLRDYQKTGWRWLLTLTRYGFGGILADDMGLGKTVQVIALLNTLQTMPGLVGKPALIVAPSSLLLNWKAEFQKFAPEMPVVVMDGAHAERLNLLKESMGVAAIITSYPLIRRDISDMRTLSFSACILDEAQHIKNPGTANARSVKQIQAAHRFAVTGTPMENTPTELWSVFDFLMPGCLLSHRQFQLRYGLPILKNGDTAALQALARLVRPFILRRLKSDVLKELPDKIETLSQCGMTKEQKRIYLTYLKKARKSFEETVRQDGPSQSRIRIFALLTRLRQICCDPELVEPGCGARSGKLEQLLEVLEDALDAGHRVLLFSQFTSMLDRIDTALEDRHIERLRLDGRTPIKKRLNLVNSFNAGKGSVFLISLKAGGTGLNLTGADMVIHYDPWWNPAVEDQATDRAHRIGQLKPVQVIRMVTLGTIEEKIQRLQERKRNLIEQVIKPGGTFLDALSGEEIGGLFDN